MVLNIDVVLYMLYFILFIFLFGLSEILFELKVRFLFINMMGLVLGFGLFLYLMIDIMDLLCEL